ncbi:3D-(3,5/4)-trihydroxycyclohexane-1,2-dione acylhydrolase (decyclizing) [Candidatus Mycoplasma pogonae]
MSATIRLTTAQALVKFIDNVYLEIDGQEHKFVYGIATIFGHGNVLGMGEALTNLDHNLKLIQGKNEQGMAHIALGYSKQNHRLKIIACTSSVGPGAANMVTAAATATANRIPLLLLPGDTFASRRPDPVLQQIEQMHDLSISTNDAFKAVSKYFDRINRPEQLINSLLWAFNVLTDPANTGAVTIALPQDVQAEAYDYPTWFFEKKVYHYNRITPNESQLLAATQLITKAKKPLIIIGGGVRYSLANKVVLNFCKKFNIPYVFTQAGKSALPSSEKLALGGIGVTGNLAANTYAKTADLVIGLGTRYTDFTTGSKTLFSENTKFVNVNLQPFDAAKMRGVSLIADIKKTLPLLEKQIKKTGFTKFFTNNNHDFKESKQSWNEVLNVLNHLTEKEALKYPEVYDKNHKATKIFLAAVNQFYQTKVEIFPQTRALYLIRKYLPKDAVITAAAGSLPGDLQRIWETDAFGSYNVEYGYSCMGHEIQAAIGSSIALGYKPSYAMVGDGSFLMLNSEMVTAVQEKVPVVVLLFDNSSFGCINNLQVGNTSKSLDTEFYCRVAPGSNQNGSLQITDFAMVSKGYGWDSVLVKNESDLIAALKKSTTTKVPMLIEIKVFPKTMTHDYGAHWQVGLAEVSKEKSIVKQAQKNKKLYATKNDFN